MTALKALVVNVRSFELGGETRFILSTVITQERSINPFSAAYGFVRWLRFIRFTVITQERSINPFSAA